MHKGNLGLIEDLFTLSNTEIFERSFTLTSAYALLRKTESTRDLILLPSHWKTEDRWMDKMELWNESAGTAGWTSSVGHPRDMYKAYYIRCVGY